MTRRAEGLDAHESKLTIIPLLMQSVALYIVALVVLDRLLCSWLFDNVTVTEIHEECELLIGFSFFFFTTHRFPKSLLLDANRLIRKFYCLISQIPIDSKKYCCVTTGCFRKKMSRISSTPKVGSRTFPQSISKYPKALFRPMRQNFNYTCWCVYCDLKSRPCLYTAALFTSAEEVTFLLAFVCL